MPIVIDKIGREYQVRSLFKTGGTAHIFAKGTTKKKATSQLKLLKALEKGFVEDKYQTKKQKKKEDYAARLNKRIV
jgi:hypothetical protein